MGWRAQMLARGLAVDTIKSRCHVVARFVEFTNDYPWRWRPLDHDQFMAELRSRETPIALSTLRSYSNAIAMFCSYVSDERYGWITFCEKQFRDVPSQIGFEWNVPRHTTDDAVPPKRRAFTKSELQHLFDAIDDFADSAHQEGAKAWLTALRYGNYGALTVRWAKGTKGSGPRRRTVLTTPEFPWVVELLEYWCSEGRGLFATADRSPALWPSERSSRLTLNALGRSFTTHRERTYARYVAARLD